MQFRHWPALQGPRRQGEAAGRAPPPSVGAHVVTEGEEPSRSESSVRSSTTTPTAPRGARRCADVPKPTSNGRSKASRRTAGRSARPAAAFNHADPVPHRASCRGHLPHRSESAGRSSPKPLWGTGRPSSKKACGLAGSGGGRRSARGRATLRSQRQIAGPSVGRAPAEPVAELALPGQSGRRVPP